ncbi:MAG TPA: glycosyltransferase, partial [Gaiellaceae bacterium]|nr:glycosyltransferase [Gaiellaceae bacterium]
TGGGVAELLVTLLGYARGVGIDADWLVIRGDPEFFAATKRIHNWLHGSPGDGGEMGTAERAAYERTIRTNADGVLDAVSPGDIVFVHDPQPAGLVPLLVDLGARVVWRCHVGIDRPNEWTDRAWDFLRPYVEPAHAYIFSRGAFAPTFLETDRLAIIAPSIDPLSPKNVELSRTEVSSLVTSADLVSRSRPAMTDRFARPAYVVREGSAPSMRVPLVVQISRWDRLKDMSGVLDGFAEHVPSGTGSQLVLAGPAFSGVADDPEAESIWEEVVGRWEALPRRDRERIHLALIPMEDPEENALVINALQRHAAIVVQKSIAEGFGLTVAEAMWKSRPVVGTSVGGIADQLVDGTSGVLLEDPRDLATFGRVITRLLESPEERRRLGRNAHRRASTFFLPDRHLLNYAHLLEWVID